MTHMKAFVDEALVRAKAFELWEARGCPIGSPEQDWFRAMSTVEEDAAPSLPLGLRIVEEPAPPSAIVPKVGAQRASKPPARSSKKARAAGGKR